MAAEINTQSTSCELSALKKQLLICLFLKQGKLRNAIPRRVAVVAKHSSGRQREKRTSMAAGIGDFSKQGSTGSLGEQAYAIFEECRLCSRERGVDRLAGETGFCRASAKLVIYSANPRYGEAESLVGRHGSGTIFFSNCNLRCVFCQN